MSKKYENITIRFKQLKWSGVSKYFPELSLHAYNIILGVLIV